MTCQGFTWPEYFVIDLTIYSIYNMSLHLYRCRDLVLTDIDIDGYFLWYWMPGTKLLYNPSRLKSIHGSVTSTNRFTNYII